MSLGLKPFYYGARRGAEFMSTCSNTGQWWHLLVLFILLQHKCPAAHLVVHFRRRGRLQLGSGLGVATGRPGRSHRISRGCAGWCIPGAGRTGVEGIDESEAG